MEATKTEHTSRRAAVSMIDVVTAPASSDLAESSHPDQAAAAAPETKTITPATAAPKKTQPTASSLPWGVIIVAILFCTALSCLTYYAYLKSN